MVLSNIALMLSGCRFYFDAEVQDQIYKLIRGAKESLSLVSPYNKHPQHLRTLLKEAIAGDVHVTMLYRDEKDQREGVTYLEREGATVLPVEWLHSKIYMNESTALASSMNLHESSFNNSSEFCIRIDKAGSGPLYKQLAEYVELIQSRSERQNLSATPEKSTPAKAAAKSVPPAARPPKAKPHTLVQGSCIRCGKASIAYNLKKPYCLKCFHSWDKDSNSLEKHCHRCGKKRKTSFAEPLCAPCYKSIAH